MKGHISTSGQDGSFPSVYFNVCNDYEEHIAPSSATSSLPLIYKMLIIILSPYALEI